jgi:hypothetical protein
MLLLFDRALPVRFKQRTTNSVRPFMGSRYSGTLAAFFAMCLAVPATAQVSLRPGQPASNPSSPAATLTGKERLGGKWTDEQRIDNCNVPIDKRGTKPRQSRCPHLPTS